MSTYDPYQRGPHAVGVKSTDIKHKNQERTIPVEIWYPASDSFIGQDLSKETQDNYTMAPGFPDSPQSAVRDAKAKTETFPLIVFSHGFAGHRRQTTHLCCHLASHGYVVIAPDHVGNTLMDIMSLAGKMQEKGFSNIKDLIKAFKDNRPKDSILCIDEMLVGSFDLTIDPESIGICGHSFGGWTSLASAIKDSRIKAIVPLAPAGGKSGQAISNGVDFSMGKIHFQHEVPCLYLVADKDTLLPLDSMQDLYQQTPQPKRMLILENSDHFHFCDNVEFIHDAMVKMGSALFGGNNDTGVLSKMEPSEKLCSGADAYAFIQACTLAHMDSYVRNNKEAQEFSEHKLLASLTEKNIHVTEYS